MWSYAAVLSMMLSAAASVVPFEILKLANLLPWAAAAADALENCIILAMLATYPQNVAVLAPHAVTASAVKWTMLSVTASIVAGLGFYCFYAAAKQAGRPAQQRQQQQQGQEARQQRKKQR
jgi:ABC-type nickel/cobalt efflux system permease component RcnA